MGRGRLRKWDYQTMSDLLEVAQGVKNADLYFSGADLINVYSGTVQKANLAVYGERIAYVGLSDKMVGPTTQVIEVMGKFLAPGYIEPHGHPFLLYNPLTYAKHVLTHGTTSSINDNLILIRNLPLDELIKLMELFGELPIKMLWSARLDPQTFADDESYAEKFSYANIRRLIEHCYVMQIGELTDWPSLLAGNAKLRRLMADALIAGKKTEGHAPAASSNTLNSLAVAGVTACHESITTEEVLRRLELGLYATLRCSSLRPDLPVLVQGLLKQEHASWERLMLTIDGPSPSFMRHGAADYLIKLAMENGVKPLTAYQMVTRNPAVYYGLEQELGGIGPGRLADILVLPDLTEPTPEQVYADGRLLVRRTPQAVQSFLATPVINWSEIGFQPLPLAQNHLRPACQEFLLLPEIDSETTFPVIDLVNPVITRRRDMPIGTNGLIKQQNRLQLEPESGLCYAVLIDREMTRVTPGIIRGFATKLDALVSSYNISTDYLLIGQNPGAMLLALQRVIELGGGIVLMQEGKIAYELPLPIGGAMSEREMPYLIQETMALENLLQEAGHPHYDPVYTLLFLTSTHLPEIRLTRDGIVLVKERRVIRPTQLLPT